MVAVEAAGLLQVQRVAVAAQDLAFTVLVEARVLAPTCVATETGVAVAAVAQDQLVHR